MTGTEALRERGQRVFVGMGSCDCGMHRDPVRRLQGAMSLLVCRRCGKLTTERKEV